MRCATYTRYSSDLQNERSIDDQVRNCRQYALRAGWTVLEEHMYEDRAISGSSTIGRQGLQQLLRAAKTRPKPFDYVLIDDTSRLSRDQVDQQNILRELMYLGIHVYFVSQGIDSMHEQAMHVMLPVHGIADSLYRLEMGKKTLRGMAGQVLKGFNPGGKTYGFTYTRMYDPNGEIDRKTGEVRFLGTRISVNAEQASVVAEIFQRFGAGWSLKELVKDMNQRGIKPPGYDSQRRILKVQPSWCPNATRFMLQNRKYIGDWAWNKTRSMSNPLTGKRRYEERPKEEWVNIIYPELRIVGASEWDKVESRFEANKQKGKRNYGGVHNTYLLSGILHCASCGARYVLVGGGTKSDPLYGCGLNWNRGRTVCPNSARVHKSELESTIIGDLRKRLFRKSALNEIVNLANEKLSKVRSTHAPEIARLEEETTDCNRAIKNLLVAIESGETFSRSIQDRLAEKETELKKIENRLKLLQRAIQAPKMVIAGEFAESWLLQLNKVFDQDQVGAKAALRTYLTSIELEPILEDGRRLLKASSKPNFEAIFDACGVSKGTNGGGVI